MSLPMETTVCPVCGTRNRLQENARVTSFSQDEGSSQDGESKVTCSECGYVLQEPDNGDITYIQ